MSRLKHISLGLLAACSLQACQDKPADSQSSAAQDLRAEQNCSQCGAVESITPIKVKGEARPAAALAGAVIGGVIGHQFGSGSGNDAATAAGAVGGAIAGSEIDRTRNATTIYQVVIRLENGERVELTKAGRQGLSIGDPVRLHGERILPLS